MTTIVRTSALTGEGIEELRAAIVAAVAGAEGGLREAAMLTNLRQHQAVEQALGGLDAARLAVAAGFPMRCCCWTCTSRCAAWTR